jgi:sn-glycerol 3-phosphate transport system permease protein
LSPPPSTCGGELGPGRVLARRPAGPNLQEAWAQVGFRDQKFVNTFIVAIGVVVGKIILACITAFALVFFNFRGRMVIFWAIFITLMLPLEVRIVPTYAVAANALSPFQTIMDWTGISWLINACPGSRWRWNWNLLNSYTGLILPLVATATGTFLYRQFFLTIPDELVEAARMDGAGPLRFLWDVLIPLSKTNIAALATIMFVYAWNQYLWPLLVITDRANYGMVVVQLSDLSPTS